MKKTKINRSHFRLYIKIYSLDNIKIEIEIGRQKGNKQNLKEEIYMRKKRKLITGK